MGKVNGTGAAPDGPLTDLYDKFAPFQGQSLDLVAQLPKGRIASFLAPLGSASTFTVARADIGYPDPYTSVTVTGSFAGLGLGTLTVRAAFTLHTDGTSLVASLSLAGALSWNWPLAPWLNLRGPNIAFEVSDNDSVPAVGTLGMAVGVGASLATLAFQAPSPVPDSWCFVGTFPPATDLSHLFELLGGVNPASCLPSPVNDLTALSLQEIALVYTPSTGAISYLSVQLGSSVVWPLLPDHAADVSSVQITPAVDAPLTSRAVSWTLAGTIAVGTGVFDVQASYPARRVSASLDPSTTISLSDFVSRFIDHPVDLAASVTSFALDVSLEAPHDYAIAVSIDADWPIPIPGGDTAFGVSNLGLHLSYFFDPADTVYQPKQTEGHDEAYGR